MNNSQQLSKEEIEKAKSNLNRILEDWQKIIDLENPIEKDIESQLYMEEMPFKEIKILLKYIDQLETNNQKLIEKLEKDIVNITKTLQDGKHCDDYSRCRLKAYRTKTQEILEILKGEKK